MTFKEDFFKPYNIFTTVLTIGSIILAVIFYNNSKKYREISFKINQPISKIFDSHNSTSALKLFERDSILVTENVYLMTGIIWNTGNLPISKEDVREAISLKLTNNKRILDFKIVNQFDPSISNFIIAKKDSNTLSLNWTYFDPGFGIRFQIIYTGNEDPGFELKGKILDIKSFINLGNKEKKSFWSQAWVFFAALLFIFLIISMLRTEKLSTFSRIHYYIMLIIFVLYIMIIVFKIVFTPTLMPNF